MQTYYNTNKDRLLENQKQYNEHNKQSISERKNQVVCCECGLEISKHNLSRHRTSKKHIDFLNSKT